MPRKLMGLCSYCQREYTLTKQGRLRKHQADPREFRAERRYHVCRGAGAEPEGTRMVVTMPKASWKW